MSQSTDPNAFEQQAPFPGHPFGGLVREDRLGNPASFADPLAGRAADGPSKPAAPDDAGGFDFHLGVYARF